MCIMIYDLRSTEINCNLLYVSDRILNLFKKRNSYKFYTFTHIQKYQYQIIQYHASLI